MTGFRELRLDDPRDPPPGPTPEAPPVDEPGETPPPREEPESGETDPTPFRTPMIT